MATDLEKLVVQLSADIKGYEREMRKAVGVTNREARAMEKRFTDMQRRFDRIGKGAARSLTAPFAGIAAALGGRELIRMTGVWTDLQSDLALAAGGADNAAIAMGRLSTIARRTYTDVTQTAEGFVSFSTVLRELGVAFEDQLDFVEALNYSLDISGARGEKAASLMNAMARAMAAGELRGQNLNTVIENGGRLTQALAESMGVTTIELRKLGQEGRIGRREMLGLATQLEKLGAEADKMPPTIRDGFTLLNNALLEYVGRGDEAVGISRMIAEALEIIADNFDTVADAGLKFAAVIAAGMLGRSLAGMIATLGSATGALISFAGAIRTVTTMGSLATSLAGLGAVAGPLGAIFGGLLAGGVILYASNSSEAARRSEDLRTELENMGLYAPEAADALDEIAEAADRIGTDAQIERIRKLRDGLESLKGSGPSIKTAILGDWSEVGRIVANLDLQAGRLFSGDSGAIAKQAAEVARAYQESAISAGEFVEQLSAIDRSGASDLVQKLVGDLIDVARVAEAAEVGLVSMGESIDSIDAANASLDDMLDRLNALGNLQGVDRAVVDQVNTIIETMRKGEMAAEDAHQAIIDLGNANPSFAGTLGAIATVIGRLSELGAAARAARVELAAASVGDGGSFEAFEQAKRDEFLDAQRRRNALSRDQLAIEREMESVMRDAAKAQVAITEEQARQLAIERVAADARRSAEGKAEKAGGAGGGRKGRAERTQPGLFEDAERELLNLQREITLIGKSTAEVAKARAEWALLDEVKKRGIPLNETLLAQIEAQAEKVGELTAELEAGRLRHEQFETAIDGIADAMANALVAGESLRKGLAQVFAGIASDLIRSGIHNLLAGLVPGSGGGGGSILGSILPGRASGGPVAAGRAYMVGERGPEPFIPAVNGRILSVPQAQAALRGGSAPKITINNNAPGVVVSPSYATPDEVVLTVSQAIQAYDRAMPQRVQQIGANPRYR